MKCNCGCGNETNLAKQTNNKLGIKKGQPLKFLFGHCLKGHGWSPVSDKCIECGNSEKKHQGHGMCTTCFKRKWGKTEKGIAAAIRSKTSPRHKEYVKKYYLNHKEEARENAKRWVKNNPDKRKLVSTNCAHRRRTDMMTTDITTDFIQELKNKSDVCPLCGITMADHGKYPDGRQLDHILPLYRGGLHLRNNVRYICARCNFTHR